MPRRAQSGSCWVIYFYGELTALDDMKANILLGIDCMAPEKFDIKLSQEHTPSPPPLNPFLDVELQVPGNPASVERCPIPPAPAPQQPHGASQLVTGPPPRPRRQQWGQGTAEQPSRGTLCCGLVLPRGSRHVVLVSFAVREELWGRD